MYGIFLYIYHKFQAKDLGPSNGRGPEPVWRRGVLVLKMTPLLKGPIILRVGKYSIPIGFVMGPMLHLARLCMEPIHQSFRKLRQEMEEQKCREGWWKGNQK